MTDTIWTKLAAPLPANAIQSRQGPGGRMLDYIDWPFIQHRLDTVVPGFWSLALEPVATIQGGEEPYACKATLTIRDPYHDGALIVRENIGTGKDWKEAATDASKRAAVRFGIGLELYEKAKPSEGEQRRPPQTVSAGASASTATRSPAPAAAASPSGEPPCPKCGGRMWDNRESKKAPNHPDFKCRNAPKRRGEPGCEGVIWPPKDTPAPAPITRRDVEEVFDAEVVEQEASLPF